MKRVTWGGREGGGVRVSQHEVRINSREKSEKGKRVDLKVIKVG